MNLRKFRDEDAATIVSWVGDEYVFKLWSAGTLGDYPITAEKLIENYNSNPDIYHLVLEDEGQMVGQIIVRYPEPGNKSVVRFGYVLVDSSIRGKGYGNALIQAAIKWVKDNLEARKITIGVFDNNEAAKRCYLGNGFKVSPECPPDIYMLGNDRWICIDLSIDI